MPAVPGPQRAARSPQDAGSTVGACRRPPAQSPAPAGVEPGRKRPAQDAGDFPSPAGRTCWVEQCVPPSESSLRLSRRCGARGALGPGHVRGFVCNPQARAWVPPEAASVPSRRGLKPGFGPSSRAALGARFRCGRGVVPAAAGGAAAPAGRALPGTPAEAMSNDNRVMARPCRWAVTRTPGAGVRRRSLPAQPRRVRVVPESRSELSPSERLRPWRPPRRARPGCSVSALCLRRRTVGEPAPRPRPGHGHGPGHDCGWSRCPQPCLNCEHDSDPLRRPTAATAAPAAAAADPSHALSGSPDDSL